MGRGIRKKLLVVFSATMTVAVLVSIITFSACSVDMLDNIKDKIVQDEAGETDVFSGILYRDMVSVTGGTYTQTDGTNSFSHTISDFKLGQYEVTYELWYTVHTWAIANGYTFANPGKEGNDGTLTDPAGAVPTAAKYEPVTTINWRDAIVWCNAYSEMSGLTAVYYTDAAYTSPLKVSTNNAVDTTAGSEDNPYVNWNANGNRLPTEGEWQYAASNKGGIPWNHTSGDTSSYCYPTDGGTSTVFGNYAWYSVNSGNVSHDVGTTANPSALTLRDMSGNVIEWCWDWYGNYPGTQTDYTGSTSGSYRVKRGGSWYGYAFSLQLGYRNGNSPDNEFNGLGFRLASKQ